MSEPRICPVCKQEWRGGCACTNAPIPTAFWVVSGLAAVGGIGWWIYSTPEVTESIRNFSVPSGPTIWKWLIFAWIMFWVALACVFLPLSEVKNSYLRKLLTGSILLLLLSAIIGLGVLMNCVEAEHIAWWGWLWGAAASYCALGIAGSVYRRFKDFARDSEKKSADNVISVCSFVVAAFFVYVWLLPEIAKNRPEPLPQPPLVADPHPTHPTHPKDSEIAKNRPEPLPRPPLVIVDPDPKDGDLSSVVAREAVKARSENRIPIICIWSSSQMPILKEYMSDPRFTSRFPGYHIIRFDSARWWQSVSPLMGGMSGRECVRVGKGPGQSVRFCMVRNNQIGDQDAEFALGNHDLDAVIANFDEVLRRINPE